MVASIVDRLEEAMHYYLVVAGQRLLHVTDDFNYTSMYVYWAVRTRRYHLCIETKVNVVTIY